ncbi:MAG: DUF502 domain-containing protein [Deferribacteres bacterium]|nr:DUF502 domain-containing protein [candidate division KSB1 bacterium]MCB9502500.1 DUF502 domain-containing protein [Deferribacteres bacterium]
MKNSSIVKRFRRYFATGLLVLVPFSLTVYIISELFQIVDGILQQFVYDMISKKIGLSIGDAPIPGLGFITLVVLIAAVGMATHNYFGRQLVNFGEYIVTRIPLISRIYITIQQISHAFFGEQREVFKSAVLFEYPRKGIYSIGFFTQDTKGPVQDALEKDVVSILAFTTPNPTSGYLLFVPKEDIIELDMPVEEALKLVISGGAIIPAKKNGNKVPFVRPVVDNKIAQQ